VSGRRTVTKHVFTGLIEGGFGLFSFTAMAQTAREILGPAPVVPLASQPAVELEHPNYQALDKGVVIFAIPNGIGPISHH
jgi:hypothetical protein